MGREAMVDGKHIPVICFVWTPAYYSYPLRYPGSTFLMHFLFRLVN